MLWPGESRVCGAEYLIWWAKGDKTPPLVSTGSPAPDFPALSAIPTPRILFGGNSLGEKG